MSSFNVIVPKGITKAVFESQVLSKFAGQGCKYYSFQKGMEIDGLVLSNNFDDMSKEDTVYIRSVLDFLRFKLIYRIKGKTIYDFRGLISEESYLKNKSKMRRLVLQLLEYFAYKKADKVWTVSNNLKMFLKSKYYNKPIEVYPCKIDRDRVVRKRLKSSTLVNFIYVGSMSEWQCFDRVCKEYSRIASPTTALTVLTADLTKAVKILSFYKINAEVKTCTRDEVLHYLDSADFGFVLRDNNIVNTTASPIKTVEYASRGVIPIMTSSVGDYSAELADMALNVDINVIDKISLQNIKNQKTLDSLYEWALRYTW